MRDRNYWLLGALASLLVAQVLLPADTVMPARGAALPQVMLWLLLLVVYLVTTVLSSGGPLRFGITDLAFGGLILLHTGAAFGAVWTGAPRPAWNVLWTWVGIGCGFFLVRQLVRTPQACRAVVAVMIAISAGLAVHGFYQVGIDFPEMRQRYERNPEAELRHAMLIAPSASISPLAKKQFEDRLYSPQPYSTFSLANALAGYLATWLVVAMGVLCGARRNKTLPAGVWYGVTLLVASVAAALALTHSRTGYLAALVGVLLLAATRCGRPRSGARAAGTAAIVILLLAVTVVGVLQLDHPRAAAARNSFAYRWQYWQASLTMIADHAGLGGGPGNFADRYTAYKLPEAYEEVADPHNFLLEVWATAGTPAMFALLLTLGCFFVRCLRQATLPVKDGSAGTEHRPIAVGGLAGFALVGVLAVAYGPVIESAVTWQVLAIVVVPAAACFGLLYSWISTGSLPSLLPVIGVVVLLLHLSASGGVGNPGVAGSLWLLIALGLNLTAAADRELRLSRPMVLAATALVLVAAIACQWTAYSPVVRSQAALSVADTFASQQDAQSAWQRLLDAADLDPHSTEPRRRIVYRLAQKWLEQHPSATAQQLSTLRAELDTQVQTWLRNAPHSSAVRRELGNIYLRLYRASGRREDLLEAIRYYEAAVQRYPHSSLLHAHLAWVHHLAGNTDDARQSAARALELDERTPHQDQKLSSPLLRIADPQPEVRQTSPAQLMAQILLN